MSAPQKCTQCGKTVYHAERQEYDGNVYHGMCLQVFKKNSPAPLQGYYPGDEDRVINKHNFVKRDVIDAPVTATGRPRSNSNATLPTKPSEVASTRRRSGSFSPAPVNSSSSPPVSSGDKSDQSWIKQQQQKKDVHVSQAPTHAHVSRFRYGSQVARSYASPQQQQYSKTTTTTTTTTTKKSSVSYPQQRPQSFVPPAPKPKIPPLSHAKKMPEFGSVLEQPPWEGHPTPGIELSSPKIEAQEEVEEVEESSEQYIQQQEEEVGVREGEEAVENVVDEENYEPTEEEQLRQQLSDLSLDLQKSADNPPEQSYDNQQDAFEGELSTQSGEESGGNKRMSITLTYPVSPKSFKKFCTQCGAALLPDHKFCGDCGAKH